jgi:hypothetical protein
MDLVRFVLPNPLFKGLEVFFAAAVGSLGETVLELALLWGVSRGSGGEVEEGGGRVDSEVKQRGATCNAQEPSRGDGTRKQENRSRPGGKRMKSNVSVTHVVRLLG